MLIACPPAEMARTFLIALVYLHALTAGGESTLNSECPVRVVSNRVHRSFKSGVVGSSFSQMQRESASYGGEEVGGGEIPSELEAGDEALMAMGGGGQFAPSPDAHNNTGMLNSEYYSPQEFTNFRCQFIFLGAVNERVQLVFHRFHLYESKRASSARAKHFNASTPVDVRCEEEDHVTAYVLVASRMSKIDDFCGSELPPQLMSARNLMTLNYMVRSIGKRHRMSPSGEYDYGFLLEYRFITDYGEQPNEAVKSPNETCSFTFDGTNQTSGDLWSPNYPGYYPRNVQCTYVFYGTLGQIILISFEYFDVEGFGQCDSSTHSDYVLFSNYRTADRTNRRYCGALRPPKSAIASESNYFRMMFSSNDIFDGTGFYAHYQFLDVQSSQRNRVKLSSSAASRHSPRWDSAARLLLTLSPLILHLRLIVLDR